MSDETRQAIKDLLAAIFAVRTFEARHGEGAWTESDSDSREWACMAAKLVVDGLSPEEAIHIFSVLGETDSSADCAVRELMFLAAIEGMQGLSKGGKSCVFP